MENKYIYEILEKLIKKYNKKNISYEHKLELNNFDSNHSNSNHSDSINCISQETAVKSRAGRRIMLKITEVYKCYEKINADLSLKAEVNDAAAFLKELQYISIDNLAYSDDIVKIYLNESKIIDIENYLNVKYNITSRNDILNEVRKMIKEYQGKGYITDYYCSKLESNIKNSIAEIDLNKEQELFRILAFIQDNKTDLYVREVSMTVYGSSKHFEDYRYENVCNILREAKAVLDNNLYNISSKMPPDADISEEKCTTNCQAMPNEYTMIENEPNDEILRRYHIYSVEQEICIKGEYIIEIGDYILETKYFSGGISISSKDVGHIKGITINTGNIITIENKTAFYRFDKLGYSSIYLGGFASRHQIEFIKLLYKNNQAHNYYHFGDIDIGGFLIHQHLCNMTAIKFKMFCMGCKELGDIRYKDCLVKLTDKDRERAEILMKNPLYEDVIMEMLERDVKLEQEIICLFIKN